MFSGYKTKCTDIRSPIVFKIVLLEHLSERFYIDADNSIHRATVECIWQFDVRQWSTGDRDDRVDVHRWFWKREREQRTGEWCLLLDRRRTYSSQMMMEKELLSIKWNTRTMESWRIDETRAYSWRARSWAMNFVEINFAAHGSPVGKWTHCRTIE